MKLGFLPSKFAAGNAALATLIFMGTGALLYLLSEAFTYVYVCGAVTFYITTWLYRQRAKRYKLMNPNVSEAIYQFRSDLDRMQSQLDDIEFSITYKQGD